VQQGAVVYVTSEGVKGVKRRLIAMRRHHGIDGPCATGRHTMPCHHVLAEALHACSAHRAGISAQHSPDDAAGYLAQ
jgi:hypothetical protein